MAEKYFLHIRSWRDGTEGMNLELEAFYLRLINLMYERDGILTDDDNLVSHLTMISKRKYTLLKKQLIEMRKIKVLNKLIINEKVTKELDFINEKSVKNSRNAKIKHAKHQHKLELEEAKSLETKEAGSANAERTHSETPCESPAIQGNRGTGDKSNTDVLPKDKDLFDEPEPEKNLNGKKKDDKEKPKRKILITTRFPTDQEFPDCPAEYQKEATERGITDWKLEWENFYNHHFNEQNRYVSWKRAWQKWINNNIKWGNNNASNRPRPSNGGGKGDIIEAVKLAADGLGIGDEEEF